MCCLFGLIDYQSVWNGKQKSKILSVLGKECEARGTDASGIAYVTHGELSIYKRPLPSHRMHYRIPKDSKIIMGHTRLTTQGSEKNNYNNHPFLGKTDQTCFALAHNSVLHNDRRLRREEHLPQSKIQTDSYVIAQLIEKEKTLRFETLQQAAEKLEGTFSFTVLDQENRLYIVKGDNPLCLCHFDGFYLYASTEAILYRALQKLRLHTCTHEKIPLACGEILQMDGEGLIQRASFHNKQFDFPPRFDWLYGYDVYSDYDDSAYEAELIRQGEMNGIDGREIRRLLALGVDEERIEEYICYPSLFREEDVLCYPK